MIGEKGDNRSVAKLYFLALSTAAQFLLIDTPLFFASLATNIFLVIYVIFMSDKFLNLNSTQPTLLENTGDGYVKFAGTAGLTIPVGNKYCILNAEIRVTFNNFFIDIGYYLIYV